MNEVASPILEKLGQKKKNNSSKLFGVYTNFVNTARFLFPGVTPYGFSVHTSTVRALVL